MRYKQQSMKQKIKLKANRHTGPRSPSSFRAGNKRYESDFGLGFPVRFFSGPSQDVLAHIEDTKTDEVSKSIKNHRETSPTTITDVPKFHFDINDFLSLGCKQ